MRHCHIRESSCPVSQFLKTPLTQSCPGIFWKKKNRLNLDKKSKKAIRLFFYIKSRILPT